MSIGLAFANPTENIIAEAEISKVKMIIAAMNVCLLIALPLPYNYRLNFA